MSSYSDSLMPGPEGKIPRYYDVDRGHKTESYITAVSANPLPSKPNYPSVNKKNEEISLVPSNIQYKDGQIGLTENQLLQYKDDPIWKATRLILFILFWLIWIIMFLGSIAIVFYSDKCIIRDKPNWWQTSIIYNVWIPSFQDSNSDGKGDINGLIHRLENLRKTGVKTVWPTPFIISDDFSNGIIDFNRLDPELGSDESIDKLIETTHEKGMNIVINLPIATTSIHHQWFIKSASASLPENKNFSQFYHWRKESPNPEFFSEQKGLYYLHERKNKQAAILNWQNNGVRNIMQQVLSDWIDRGIDGFHLSDIEYLARTSNGSAPDWKAIFDILRDIRDHVDSYANEIDSDRKIVLFATREEAKEKDKQQLTNNALDTIINYEFGRVEKDSEICHRDERSIATCIHEILSDVLTFHKNYPKVWPQWQFGSPSLSRISTRIGSRSHSELLLLLQLLLPGTNNIYYGEEIGMKDVINSTHILPQRSAMQWDDSSFGGFTTASESSIPINSDYRNTNWKRQFSEASSSLKMFSKLAKLRSRDETLMAGQTFIGNLMNGSFSITRFIKLNESSDTLVGNIYVGAINLSNEQVNLSLDIIPGTKDNHNLKCAKIVAITSNVQSYSVRQSIDLSSKKILLKKSEGIVFRYPAK